LKPNQKQIKEARLKAGITQQQAAEIVHRDMRSWRRWEAGQAEIDPAIWELFLIKTRGKKNGTTRS
jgi:DNA-binding transcriptional regulator YiaG